MASERKSVPSRGASAKLREGTPARPPKRSAPAPAAVPAISAQMRQHMIAEAAYFRAEQRQFAPGFDVDDWLAAEQAIDELLSAPTLQ